MAEGIQAMVEGLLANLASANKKDIFHMVIILEAVATLCFVICSFVVAGTANVGFNCVLTGFLYIAFIAGSYYVIENSKSPIAVSDNFHTSKRHSHQ